MFMLLVTYQKSTFKYVFRTKFIYLKKTQNIPLWTYIKHTLPSYWKIVLGMYDILKTHQWHIKNICYLTYLKQICWSWHTENILNFGMLRVDLKYVCPTSDIPKKYLKINFGTNFDIPKILPFSFYHFRPTYIVLLTYVKFMSWVCMT